MSTSLPVTSPGYDSQPSAAPFAAGPGASAIAAPAGAAATGTPFGAGTTEHGANATVPVFGAGTAGHGIAVPTRLAARLEPFDSYWQAPADVESGYKSFSAYYRANYLAHIPADRNAKILIVSCGPGYLVDLLTKTGYRNVLGIDSDAGKVEYARRRGLSCEVAEVFPFLSQHPSGDYDCIIPEQELNHLTLDETIVFLKLCRAALRPKGNIIVYAMNGANPLVGSENLAHNIDHFYNLTEHSIGQLLQLGGFESVKPFALKLYVFWKNPLNYVGLAVTGLMEAAMKVIFVLYGKKVKIVSKKIAAVGHRSAAGIG